MSTEREPCLVCNGVGDTHRDDGYLNGFCWSCNGEGTVESGKGGTLHRLIAAGFDIRKSRTHGRSEVYHVATGRIVGQFQFQESNAFLEMGCPETFTAEELAAVVQRREQETV